MGARDLYARTYSDVHMRVKVQRCRASKLLPPNFLRVRASFCTSELLLLVFFGPLVRGKQLYTRSVHVMHSSAGAVPFVHFTRAKRLSKRSLVIGNRGYAKTELRVGVKAGRPFQIGWS